MRIEEEYTDVLQNIEAGIVTVYDQQPALMDCEVLDALEALSRRYKWGKEGRGIPSARLFGRSQQVFDIVSRICEWRLGRESPNSDDIDSAEPAQEPLGSEEILLCLQHIRSSVRLWNKEGGRQGYLQYVSEFLSEAARRCGRMTHTIGRPAASKNSSKQDDHSKITSPAPPH